MHACKRVPRYYFTIFVKNKRMLRVSLTTIIFHFPQLQSCQVPARCLNKICGLLERVCTQVREFEILLFLVFIALPPPWTADGGIIMDGLFVNKDLLMTSQYKNHLCVRTQGTPGWLGVLTVLCLKGQLRQLTRKKSWEKSLFHCKEKTLNSILLS